MDIIALNRNRLTGLQLIAFLMVCTFVFVTVTPVILASESVAADPCKEEKQKLSEAEENERAAYRRSRDLEKEYDKRAVYNPKKLYYLARWLLSLHDLYEARKALEKAKKKLEECEEKHNRTASNGCNSGSCGYA